MKKDIQNQINTYLPEANCTDVVLIYNDDKSVDLEIVGRAGTINKLTVDDIVVSIDYSEISEGEMGVVELPINVSSADGNIYFRVERQLPETISVTVYSSN